MVVHGTETCTACDSPWRRSWLDRRPQNTGKGALPPPTSERYSTINDIAGIVLASRLPHAFQVAVLQGWQRFPEAASVTLEDLPRSVLF